MVISWVSFWLNREATSDRISLGIGLNDINHSKHFVNLIYNSQHVSQQTANEFLSPGITTVLTMTFLGLEARKDLPKVVSKQTKQTNNSHL